MMPTHVNRDERSTSFKSCFNDEELDDNDDDSAASAMQVVFEAHEEEEEADSAKSGIIDIVATPR
jgi:hypothetical protein